MSTTPSITAWELRKLAEAAHGTRGKALSIVWRNGSLQLVEQTATGDVVVFGVDTPPTLVRNAGTNFKVMVQGTNPSLGDVTSLFDAFFWTESSIEKFFFPYYAGILDATAYAMLVSSFYDGNAERRIVAFGHLPGTQWTPVSGTAVDVDGAVVLYLDANQTLQIEGLKGWIATL